MIYRKLHNIDGTLNSIWEYNPENNMERMIWSAYTIIMDYHVDWTTYIPVPPGGSPETDITKEEAEEIMFVDFI